MSSWEYERWDGQKRTLVHYNDEPDLCQLGDEPDIRDVIVSTLQHVIVRVLFPRGLPWVSTVYVKDADHPSGASHYSSSDAKRTVSVFDHPDDTSAS